MSKIHVISANNGNLISSDIFLIPSHYGVKKDIYAYNIVGDFVGVVSVKEREGFITRDNLMEECASELSLSVNDSFSLKCKVVEQTDKKIVLEKVNLVRISNVSVFKTQPVSVTFLELAHIPCGSPSITDEKVQHHVIKGLKGKSIQAKPKQLELISNSIIEQATKEFKDIKDIKKELKEIKKAENRKENGDDNMMKKFNLGMNMKNIFGGEIGMVKSDDVRLGLDGSIAIKRADGDYVTFKEDGTVINVSQFAFDMGGLFILPVTIDKVKRGDIIIKDGRYYHVDEDGVVGKGLQGTAVDNSEIKEFRLTKSMLLNNEYVRKVVSPFSMFGVNNNDSNNSLMTMAMLSGMDFGDEKSEMFTTLMMAQAINGGNNGMDIQKMLPFLMMGGNKGDMSQLFMMSAILGQGNIFGGQPTQAKEDTITKKDVEKIVTDMLTND